MSFADSNCVCGGKKIRNTLVCDACEEALKDHPSMKAYNNFKLSVADRSHAAHVIIAVAGKRLRNQNLELRKS